MSHHTISRRHFVRIAAGAGLCGLPLVRAARARGVEVSDHEALFYEKLEGGRVKCALCPWECTVPDGRRGNCNVRENQGGVYRSLVYGRVCAAHVDPIEKKPLFHFLPGTQAFSIATAGCNVECQFCQNWDISQALPEDLPATRMSPDQVVAAAQEAGSKTIAFTYSEPTIFYEFMLDTATAAKKAGVHAVTISNGFIRREPMERLCEVISAIKIDLKGFTEEFYKKQVRGELKPVLETIKAIHGKGVHLELVTLLIPGLNDSEKEVRELSRWVVDNVGPDVPAHFSRFHPAYKMTNLPQTPKQTVIRAREVAVDEGVHYAYVGNMSGHPYESTYCHACGKKLIERYAFYSGKPEIKDGKCAFCGAAVPGVWS
jgi:pyruvate formate lyase activating enzyme